MFRLPADADKERIYQGKGRKRGVWAKNIGSNQRVEAFKSERGSRT